MSLTILRYYLLKDAQKYISPSIRNGLEYSSQDDFKYALFLDASKYYHPLHPFKIDYYQLTPKLFGGEFENFMTACLEQAYLHSSDEEKIFCYNILISYLTEQLFRPYIEAIATKKKKVSYIEKMLEAYYFNKNEGKSIHKMNLADYFFDAFELSEADLCLIEKPIKRIFGFFSTKNYFKICYHHAQFYYNHLVRSKTGIKKILYFFYDILFNHRKQKQKTKNYLYPRRIDTTILNLAHKSYSYQDKESTASVEDLYQTAQKLSKEACIALNEYFNFHQNDKPFHQLMEKLTHLA